MYISVSLTSINAESELLRNCLVVVLHHVRVILKCILIKDKFILKKPFARRALDNSAMSVLTRYDKAIP
mgnify:CR=1 FL=1|tara:strand:- start:362 stop:568 length:207 start_codon:yes stop_codon:yes gene_type:complete